MWAAQDRRRQWSHLHVDLVSYNTNLLDKMHLLYNSGMADTGVTICFLIGFGFCERKICQRSHVVLNDCCVVKWTCCV